MKLIRVHETTEDEPVNWGNNAELKTTEEKYLRALKQETSMRHQCEVFLHSILPYEKELIKAYNPDKFPVPISHMQKFQYSYWGLPKGAPNGETVWKGFMHY